MKKAFFPLLDRWRRWQHSALSGVGGTISRARNRGNFLASPPLSKTLGCLLAIPLIIACVSGRAEPVGTVILVSIDGFGHDYLDRFEPPMLMAIAGAGFRVRRLQPVYPTNTFPTHLSMATGQLPEAHGLEDNHFCDGVLGECYHLGSGKSEPHWLRGMPVWSWVEAQGGIAATYFWPESDASWGGRLPTYSLPYDKAAPYAARVGQVLDWLQLPDAARPHLVTLYFSLVDTAGHDFGPGSAEVAAAVNEVDRHIGDLWRGIEAMDRPDINMLVVSDHGMTTVESDQAILTTELPELPGFKMLHSPARIRYYPEDDAVDIDAFRAQLRAFAAGRFEVLDRDAARALGGNTETTAPAITLLTQPPAYFSRFPDPPGVRRGAHGYLADHPDMAAFAVGIGPAFRAGEVDEAHQLDIFPLLLEVLGLPAPGQLASEGGALLSILGRN